MSDKKQTHRPVTCPLYSLMSKNLTRGRTHRPVICPLYSVSMSDKKQTHRPVTCPLYSLMSKNLTRGRTHRSVICPLYSVSKSDKRQNSQNGALSTHWGQSSARPRSLWSAGTSQCSPPSPLGCRTAPPGGEKDRGNNRITPLRQREQTAAKCAECKLHQE